MLYAAKCYWPGVTPYELERAAHVAATQGDGYVGSLLFRADGLVLCFFHGTSPAAVRRAAEQAGMPCERVMASQWLPSSISERTTR
jgi:hypothetical protein